MTPPEVALLIAAVVSSAAGQLFLKLGALKLGAVTVENALQLIFKIVVTPELLVGLAAYGLGAIAYILLLTRVKLSVAAPAGSLIYLFSVLAGVFIFKEGVSVTRCFGLALIMGGVVLVAAR